jgi:hypothetical protein
MVDGVGGWLGNGLVATSGKPGFHSIGCNCYGVQRHLLLLLRLRLRLAPSEPAPTKRATRCPMQYIVRHYALYILYVLCCMLLYWH